MKLFIIMQYFPEGDRIGGAELQCLNMANYFSSHGHEVVYYALKKGEAGKTNVPFKIIFGGDEKNKIWVSLWNLLVSLKKERPDICYLRDFKYLFSVSKICALCRVPLVFNTTHIDNCSPRKAIASMHGFLSWFMPILINIKQRLNFYALKKVNVVTVVREHVDILKKQGIRSLNIYNSIRDNLGGNHPAKVKQIVWVSNLKKRKRPEVFVELAKRFRKSGYRFIMVGNLHSNTDYYKKLIREEESKNVEFQYLGGKSIAEVESLLAKSLVLVSTCEPEGFPNIFIQAWCNYCPTLSLKYDPDNVIADNDLGYVSGSLDRLEDDLQKLLQNSKRLDELSKRVREYAKNNHNIEKNMGKFEKYFNNIIQYARKIK